MYKQGKSTRIYHKQSQNGIRDEQIILTDYIRYQIHHPDNHLNPIYTKEELRQSIESMREFIADMKKNNPESDG